MFTGIVQHVGVVRRTEPAAAGRRLAIDVGPLAEGLRLGDSIAINGACLSATSLDGPAVGFDAVPETLARTNLGRLSAGSRVNLERAMALGGRLDGHLVQGHIDGLARLERVDRTGGQWWVSFTCDRALTDEMVGKGSVALDGVSLTLVDVSDGRFSVALIPMTLRDTTLGERGPGDPVNVETDVLGKYVRRMLGQLAEPGGGLTLEKLRQAGFA